MPKPQIRWLKQGVEIKHSQEYIIEELEDGTSILIIPEVYQDDMGEIVFEAYNPLGVTSTIAALSVESKFFTILSKCLSNIIKEKPWAAQLHALLQSNYIIKIVETSH